MTDLPAKNTDKILWATSMDDLGYADILFLTEGGGIGINVNGHVIVKPLRDWHALASKKYVYDKERRTLTPAPANLRDQK